MQLPFELYFFLGINTIVPTFSLILLILIAVVMRSKKHRTRWLMFFFGFMLITLVIRFIHLVWIHSNSDWQSSYSYQYFETCVATDLLIGVFISISFMIYASHASEEDWQKPLPSRIPWIIAIVFGISLLCLWISGGYHLFDEKARSPEIEPDYPVADTIHKAIKKANLTQSEAVKAVYKAAGLKMDKTIPTGYKKSADTSISTTAPTPPEKTEPVKTIAQIEAEKPQTVEDVQPISYPQVPVEVKPTEKQLQKQAQQEQTEVINILGSATKDSIEKQREYEEQQKDPYAGLKGLKMLQQQPKPPPKKLTSDEKIEHALLTNTPYQAADSITALLDDIKLDDL